MNKKVLRNVLPYLGLLIVVIVFEILTSGALLTKNNLKLIFEQSILVMISAFGVVMVMSMGALDFSQGAMIGIASVVLAKTAQFNIPLGVIAAILLCVGIGILNGILNAVLKIPSFIATICMMQIFGGLTVYFTSTSAISIPFSMFAYNKTGFKLVIVVVLAVVTFYLFRFTPFGRSCRAIGSGERAAFFSGIRVTRMKILAFAFAGLMAGIAACLNIVRTGSASANTGNLQETNVMIALVLGGLPVSGGAKSRFSSAIVGSVLVATLTNGLVLLGLGSTTQQLVKGMIFLGVVAISVDRKSAVASK